VPLFCLSLKAGGTGLNLTAADTVIHYDPWWNPAAEAQATDRAHRIGQDKPVFVYKLIAEGTIEERMLELQGRKATLANGLFDPDQGNGGFEATDLDLLFHPLACT
jgi:SNF2 family DNA or RNA helicase